LFSVFWFKAFVVIFAVVLSWQCLVGRIYWEIQMKKFLMVSVVFAAIFVQAEVEFNKVTCQRAMPAGFSALCSAHEVQMGALSFRKDAVYGYSYSSCDKYSGQITAASTNAIPCVVYFVESESKKEIAIQSIFGNTPRRPLSYKGLFVNFVVRPKQVQMGHNSGVQQRQYGESRPTLQYGDGQNGSSQQQMQ